MISLANAALKINAAFEPCDRHKRFNGLCAAASGTDHSFSTRTESPSLKRITIRGTTGR